LTLKDRHLRQLTHEERAGRATWSPDGKAITYLRYDHWTHDGWPAEVSRISAQGGQAEFVTTPPRLLGSTFCLPDGRLAWSVIEQDNQSSFHAHAKLEVQDIAKPTKSLAGEANTVHSISNPRLSPDGRTLVFGVAGYLWRQRLDGGKPQRISQDTARESEPAFSPDGHRLAFVRTEHGEDSVLLLDLVTGQTRS